MELRFAFVGFRHSHVFGLIDAIRAIEDTAIVACCEEDPDTRKTLAEDDRVEITHDTFERMLAEVDCDVVVIADYFAKRGSLAIRALQAGKHVMSDKPLCTSLGELDQIATIAQAGTLSVGMQLDLRCDSALRTMRSVVQAGAIGQVHTVTFTGQHPLSLGSRPSWYFEPGCQGGTINDIAVHGIDITSWVSGLSVIDVVAARVWNARARKYRHFQDGAQLMLRLDNDGGVLADVSYLGPEDCGPVPQYWRFTFHGDKGLVEGIYGHDTVLLAANSSKNPRAIPVEPAAERVFLSDFIHEVNGRPMPNGSLTTKTVLQVSRIALKTQRVADVSFTT